MKHFKPLEHLWFLDMVISAKKNTAEKNLYKVCEKICLLRKILIPLQTFSPLFEGHSFFTPTTNFVIDQLTWQGNHGYTVSLALVIK